MGTSHAEGEALRRLIERAYELVVGAQIRETKHERERDLQDARVTLEAALAPLSGPVDASGERIPDISTTDLEYAAKLIESRITAEAPEFQSLLRGRVNRIRNLNIWLSKYGPYGTAAVPSSPAKGLPTIEDMVGLVDYGGATTRQILDDIRGPALPPSSPVADKE